MRWPTGVWLRSFEPAPDRHDYPCLILTAMYGFKDLVDYLVDKKVDIAKNILEYILQIAVQRNLSRLYDYVQEPEMFKP